MKQLLTLALLLTTVACQASSYIRPPYTLGQERCEKVVIHDYMMLIVCELSVGFERTCYIIQKDLSAYMATSCKFYDEVVRSPKIVR